MRRRPTIALDLPLLSLLRKTKVRGGRKTSLRTKIPVILKGTRTKGGLYKLQSTGISNFSSTNAALASEQNERTSLTSILGKDQTEPFLTDGRNQQKDHFKTGSNLLAHNLVPDAKFDLVISQLKTDIVKELLDGLKNHSKTELSTPHEEMSKKNRPSSIHLQPENPPPANPEGDTATESTQLQRSVRKKKARAQRVFCPDDQLNFDTWHKRFGHLSSMENTIKASAAYGIPKDMSLLKKPTGDSCIDCIKGKQKRKQHASTEAKTKPKRVFKPGEKIHIDTKKFEVPGIGNYTHWMTIVDEASGAEIGCPTRGRTAIEIMDIMDRKRKWLKIKTGNELKEIQCDGAKEFVEGIANDKNWAGVTISSSSPHSPEENGRAERMNQTRSNTSITLLSQSRLGKRFWPYSERMAATHINYTVPDKEEKTRWELLTGEKPDYANIHPFGCHAFCHVPKENRKALDPKSRPGLYLGESEKKSGVLVWDPKTQRVFESNSTLYDYKRFGAQELLARFDGKSPIPEYYLAEEFNPEKYTSKVYSYPPYK